jgi:hypothetical protein
MKELTHGQTHEAVALTLLEEETRCAGVQRLFLIDACRAPLLAHQRRSGHDEVVFDARNVVAALADSADEDELDFSPLTIVSACEKGFTALEIKDLKRGLFTLALEQVIAEHVATGEGVVVGDAFTEKVRKAMIRLAREHGLVGRQKPSRTLVGPPFELVPSTAPEPVTPPPEPDPPARRDRTRWVLFFVLAPSAVAVVATRHFMPDVAVGWIALRAVCMTIALLWILLWGILGFTSNSMGFSNSENRSMRLNGIFICLPSAVWVGLLIFSELAKEPWGAVRMHGPAPLKAVSQGKPFVNTLRMRFAPRETEWDGKGYAPVESKERVLISVLETQWRDLLAADTAQGGQEHSFLSAQDPAHPAEVDGRDVQNFCVWLTETERKLGKIGPDDWYQCSADVFRRSRTSRPLDSRGGNTTSPASTLDPGPTERFRFRLELVTVDRR